MSKEQKHFETLLKQGKITRREFITRLSALGLTVTLSPGFFSTTAQASQPQKGGRLRTGLAGGATTDSLDPATMNDLMAMDINWQIRNNLVEIDHNLNPIPELAEGWEASPDAKQWVFNLRKGVEFHNGKTLGTEDVIYSINHHRGEASKSAAKSIVDQITDIKADGKNKVVFTLKGGNADFPFILSDYHLSIFPAETKKETFEKGIGTGGYILEAWEPGVRAFAKRNPNYWKQGRAHFDEVETLGIADVNARTNALKTGRIDHMNRCDLKTIHLLEKDPRVKVMKFSGTWHYTMPMMTDIAPFDNNDVRLALKYAVDRELMLKMFLQGYGSIGNDHPIAPIQRYFASELPQRHYDPDKAKFHLKKAGLENHTFKLHTSTVGGFLDQSMLFQESAAKAGIKIELVQHPADGYWSDIWLKKPFVGCYWSGRATEDWMFSTSYSKDASWNDSHWKHDKFNRLLIEARAELNEAKRREMYVEMQRIVRDEGGVIVHLFKDYVEATNLKIRHGEIAGNWGQDGCRFAERWWFAS